MKYAIVILISLYIGYALGARDADEATFKDCATQGSAKLENGTEIKCSLK